jgi:glutaconate CoA-transferase subunit B
MIVASLHPRVTREQVQENIGWHVRFAENVETTEAPSVEELRLIREELDPKGLYSR